MSTYAIKQAREFLVFAEKVEIALDVVLRAYTTLGGEASTIPAFVDLHAEARRHADALRCHLDAAAAFDEKLGESLAP